MKIDEAIKELELLAKGGHGGYDGVRAIKLGIEALKRTKSQREAQMHVNLFPSLIYPLDGETN